MTQICDISFTFKFQFKHFQSSLSNNFEKQKLKNFITTEIMKMKINLDLIFLYVHGPFFQFVLQREEP